MSITGADVDPRQREFFNYRTKVQRKRTEAKWEEWLIKELKKLGWKFRKDFQEDEKTKEYLLEKNLLIQLERFYRRKENKSSFRFTAKEKNYLLREFYEFKFRDLNKPIILSTTEENGRKLEIQLIDKENIDNNCFEVVQQVQEYHRGKFTHIYDLVLLINGLPLVCIELKKATICNSEAFEQLKRYIRDRFISKPLSIFNNFQLFIATNFQRISYFWKKDINNLMDLDRLTLKLCNNDFFQELRYISLLFSPSKIVEQLFQSETRFSKKLKSLQAKETSSQYTGIKRDRVSQSTNTQHYCQYKRSTEKPAFVWIFFVTLFLLINFLSGWKWWTILIGLAILGYILYKLIS